MARKLDEILVVDVESTCWDGAPPDGEESEIIEIGLCVVAVGTLTRSSKHSILVKPDRSSISEFCSNLTTLRTEMFVDAGSFADACRRLRKEFAARDCLWASWGDYDRRQFGRCCEASNVGYPFGISHLNVKTLSAISLGLPHEVGLDAACQKLGIEMEGTHHRGDDDAWNIAGVLCRLLSANRSKVA